METRTYTEKSNARRAASAAGIDPNLVFATDDGFTFTPPAETNGHDQTEQMPPLKEAIDIAIKRGISPTEFVAIAESAADELDSSAPKVDDDIPGFCKLSPETRKAAWIENPPKAAPIKETIPMAKTKTAKSKDKQPKVDKTATLLGMLKGSGASVEELTKATGWLAHTLRARLSGLAKPKSKGGVGLKIERERVEGVTTYRVAS